MTLFPTSYVVVVFGAQWFEVKGVHVVDIGRIVDHHCLKFLFMMLKGWRK
jgi:hypothetical protein